MLSIYLGLTELEEQSTTTNPVMQSLKAHTIKKFHEQQQIKKQKIVMGLQYPTNYLTIINKRLIKSKTNSEDNEKRKGKLHT